MSERLGAYTLVETLGQGGMADVYLATAPRADGDHHVAVKVLNAQRSLDAESCALFLDEARLVRMLDHKNIASVLDVDALRCARASGCRLRDRAPRVWGPCTRGALRALPDRRRV